MAVDAAFVGAGQAPGLTLWRIENKQVVLQPEPNGKFHTGDSYILLSTKQTSSAFEWDIHFWLGEETSQDEAGIAAYKTVELDEGMGGGPVQHREVQGNESALFMSYFKENGVEYLPGGVESGFRHVDRDAYETRLLMCKGRRTVRVKEVEVSNASLNTGDVFILDMGLNIYVWNGPEANRYEKAKGVETARKIKDQERGGRAQITIVNEDPSNAEFWGALGGEITVTNPGEDDSAAERKAAEDVHLFKISDASGELEFTEVAIDGSNLHRESLDTNDVFLVDDGNELFVWVGHGANPNEKREGMMYAQNYLTQYGRPFNTQITRVAEGTESTKFKALFQQWDPPQKFDFSRTASVGVARVEQKAVDYGSLHARQEAQDAPIDDGSGTLQVWRVENFAKVEVDADQIGQFYGGDSYVLLYTYEQNGVEQFIIYFWQGRQSSADEKGSSALLAKELDDELGDRPVQVRVVQGKEPSHFRQLFRGSMIVHAGGKASGFKNREDTDSFDTDGIALFHVKGTTELNTYGVQVEEVAGSLNSGDCFVLVTPTHVYSWHGRGSNEAEHAVADNIANILTGYLGVEGRALETVPEGEEPAEFWAAIGGEGEYPAQVGDEIPQEPRLFQCSNATGTFAVTEIEAFAQEDLIDEDVMLLDTFNSVFIWVGSQANDEEKRKAIEAAQQYINTAPDGRDADTPILRVHAGREPGLFTQYFVGWDPQITLANMSTDAYQAQIAALAAEQEGAASGAPAAAPVVEQIDASAMTASGFADPTKQSFTLEQLQNGEAPNIDPAMKEMYLSDSDFQGLFGMDKAAFEGLAKWKRQKAKKQHGLF